MDAPKCKICGERHYGLCPAFQTKPVRVDKARNARSLPQAAKPVAKVLARPSQRPVHKSDGLVRSKLPEPEPAEPQAFDHVAYQREYMRKRRAKIRQQD